jgi:hypothetical protein
LTILTEEKQTIFRGFAVFEGFCGCNGLSLRRMRRLIPFLKNHTKKPTVGFLFSRTYVKMHGYE